uniref:Reverse transcriptase domain-containing protein n=1 Tax=Macrostomum lignano TaxID=282301 RepID=A0A1I8I291_9PLAT
RQTRTLASRISKRRLEDGRRRQSSGQPANGGATSPTIKSPSCPPDLRPEARRAGQNSVASSIQRFRQPAKPAMPSGWDIFLGDSIVILVVSVAALILVAYCLFRCCSSSPSSDAQKLVEDQDDNDDYDDFDENDDEMDGDEFEVNDGFNDLQEDEDGDELWRRRFASATAAGRRDEFDCDTFVFDDAMAAASDDEHDDVGAAEHLGGAPRAAAAAAEADSNEEERVGLLASQIAETNVDAAMSRRAPAARSRGRKLSRVRAPAATIVRLMIFRPQQRDTFTVGHSNSEVSWPSLLNTATWNLLPWESPTRTSPWSLMSMPLGKLVIASEPMRRRYTPSSWNTQTQWPLKSQMKYSLPLGDDKHGWRHGVHGDDVLLTVDSQAGHNVNVADGDFAQEIAGPAEDLHTAALAAAVAHDELASLAGHHHFARIPELALLSAGHAELEFVLAGFFEYLRNKYGKAVGRIELTPRRAQRAPTMPYSHRRAAAHAIRVRATAAAAASRGLQRAAQTAGRSAACDDAAASRGAEIQAASRRASSTNGGGGRCCRGGAESSGIPQQRIGAVAKAAVRAGGAGAWLRLRRWRQAKQGRVAVGGGGRGYGGNRRVGGCVRGIECRLRDRDGAFDIGGADTASNGRDNRVGPEQSGRPVVQHFSSVGQHNGPGPVSIRLYKAGSLGHLLGAFGSFILLSLPTPPTIAQRSSVLAKQSLQFGTGSGSLINIVQLVPQSAISLGVATRLLKIFHVVTAEHFHNGMRLSAGAAQIIGAFTTLGHGLRSVQVISSQASQSSLRIKHGRSLAARTEQQETASRGSLSGLQTGQIEPVQTGQNHRLGQLTLAQGAFRVRAADYRVCAVTAAAATAGAAAGPAAVAAAVQAGAIDVVVGVAAESFAQKVLENQWQWAGRPRDLQACDVIALQEMSIRADLRLYCEDLGAGWTLWYTQRMSRGGVGALIGPRLQQSCRCVSLSSWLLWVDIQLCGRNAHLFCAYAPPATCSNEAQAFFEQLLVWVEGMAQRDTVVIFGDLNAVLRRSEQLLFVTARKNGNTGALEDFLERQDMVGRQNCEAEETLVAVYLQRQQFAVVDAIQAISDARPDARGRVAWSIITLTGQKRRIALNLAGNTLDEHKNELREFFAAIVNAPPLPLPENLRLPLEMPLLAEESFNVAPVNTADVSLGGKVLGLDEVPTEVLRIHCVATEVARVMKRVLSGEVAPNEWTTAHIIAIPKKPGTTKLEEHRGICLQSCATKLFNRMLLLQLQPVLDPYLRPEQNRFQPHRGTVTQILAFWQVIEGARIHQLTLILIDFRKAFDLVMSDALPEVLHAYMPELLISAVMALYHGTTAAVSTPDGLSDFFETSSGVLQGDTLVPFLFILVLWTALPSNNDGFLLWRCVGQHQLERRLSMLGYADDLALLSSTVEGAQRQLDRLVAVAASVGLVVNMQKTEVLCMPNHIEATIFCQALTDRRQFVYLGGLVPDICKDLLRRRGLAWAAFHSISLLRAAFKIGNERVTNMVLYHCTGLAHPSNLLCRRRLQLAGHVISAEAYYLEPVQEARTRHYVNCLLADAGAPDSAGGAAFVRIQALKCTIDAAFLDSSLLLSFCFLSQLTPLMLILANERTTTRGGICHTDKLFQQTGQLMTIAITLYRSDEMSLSYRNSLLHFNATGFADFRGDKLILVIASNAAKRRIELRIEDPAALRVPLEIFHNLHQPDGLSIGSPLPPGQQLTVNRFSRSIAGLNDILSEMGRLRPAAYVGAILVIPYTNAVPEARFSRVAGRYPSPPHVDSEAACQSRSNYKMLQPLLRHFAQVARQPVPVQLFDTRSQMAQPFCRLQPDATIIALHFINGEPLVAMATIIVSLIGSESTLVLLADWGAACPRRLRLRADNSLLAPSTAAGPNASLAVRHNCADDTEIWAESNLLDSVGDRVRIESVPELSLASIRSTGRLLRHFMIQSGRFRNSDSEITFDVQFNQWVFRPMAALQTKRIVSGFTADSALVHLDKSVLNNCTHGLTNLSIGDCPLIDNGTHLHRLLPTVGLLSACRMRRSGNHMLATLSASVQLPSNAGQFLISLPFSWTLPAGISANLPLTEQTRDSRASPTSASSAASAALDKFPFRLTVSQLLLDGHSRAIELQSTRLEYLYSGELIHCELIVRGCGQPVPLVSDGCTRSGALWLGPGVAVPLLRLPSSLPSRVCSGSGTRMAVVACRLAVCRLAEPELAGLTSDE